MSNRSISVVRDALISAVVMMVVASIATFLFIYKVYWALPVIGAGVTTFLLVLRYHPSRFYKRVVWTCMGLLGLFGSIPGFRAAGVLRGESEFSLFVDSVGNVALVAVCFVGVVALIVNAITDYLQNKNARGEQQAMITAEEQKVMQMQDSGQQVMYADKSPVVYRAEKVDIHYEGQEKKSVEDNKEEIKERRKKKAEFKWPSVSLPLGGPKVSEPFAGRKVELEELEAAIGGKNSIIAVVGMAGQGKSCLIGEWYKKGVFLPNGVGLFWRKVYEAGYSFDRFLDELYLYLTGEEIDRQRNNTTEVRTELVEAVLSKRPCYIFLDGF